MAALFIIIFAVVAVALASLLRDAPERRVEQYPRGWWPASPRR
jgi:hypothetical protein